MVFMSGVFHALVSCLLPCGHMKGQDWYGLLALVCDVYCIFFLLSHLVSWDRCGT